LFAWKQIYFFHFNPTDEADFSIDAFNLSDDLPLTLKEIADETRMDRIFVANNMYMSVLGGISY
jgi:hypothetical protein